MHYGSLSKQGEPYFKGSYKAPILANKGIAKGKKHLLKQTSFSFLNRVAIREKKCSYLPNVAVRQALLPILLLIKRVVYFKLT